MRRLPRLPAALPTCAAVLLAGILALGAGAGAGGGAPDPAVAQSTALTDGRIGEALGVLNNGRHLHPYGTLTPLGNFPTGGAITPDGRFYWTVSTGRGINDVRIVSVAGSTVIQTIRLAGASGGVAIDPVHPIAYVSGVADSTFKGDKSPPGTPGLKGDAVLVFAYDARTGRARFERQIDVPPPSSATVPQDFPANSATSSLRIAWPDRLAVSRDGSRLLVPLNLGDAAAVIDVATKTVRYVQTGHYPYGAAISRDGRFGYVSNEAPGTVTVIDMRRATRIADVQVGAHLSHPEAVLADPTADRVYVTLTNSDEVAVIDTKTQTLKHTVPVGRAQGLGTSPEALAETGDGHELLVAEGGTDEIAVLALPGNGSPSAYSLVGRIPTAQYPTDVQVTPGRRGCTPARPKAKSRKKARRHHHRHRHHPSRHHHRHRRARHRRRKTTRPAARAACAKLLYVSAKGMGTGPNPAGPQPNTPQDTDSAINATEYLPLLNLGAAGSAAYPSDAAIRGLTAVADAQVSPSNPEPAPADTPLRPGGPIKHVFFIVRENRTYDQVLGDDPRGDGDPGLVLFGGRVTPNAHALVQRFPLIDHFYANSEASIDGHQWTAAAGVTDYINKNWFQNYAGRGRPYDFGLYVVGWPVHGYLFDQADQQGISYFNYGEAAAGDVPPPFVSVDKDMTPAERQASANRLAKSDLEDNGCYPNDASIGSNVLIDYFQAKVPVGTPPVQVWDATPPPGAPQPTESRADCFKLHFTQQLSGGAVPTFNYLVLSNDHTRVLDPASRTPTAFVADNDQGLGEIVDTISHSSIWSSSAIFVTEDDSQDGADHVDAHRTVGMIISPYARPAAVIHTRYDMLSMIRSMELVMGMRPLGLFDALATPMYDAFQSSPANSAPYTTIPAKVDLLATNPTPASAAQARALRFRGMDAISQYESDRLLWRSVHGAGSTPPPPGPNAVAESADSCSSSVPVSSVRCSSGSP